MASYNAYIRILKTWKKAFSAKLQRMEFFQNIWELLLRCRVILLENSRKKVIGKQLDGVKIKQMIQQGTFIIIMGRIRIVKLAERQHLRLLDQNGEQRQQIIFTNRTLVKNMKKKSAKLAYISLKSKPVNQIQNPSFNA